MAKRTTVHLVDDLDGSEAGETVEFGLDGTEYELDLTDEHAAQLRDALAPYVGASRKLTRAKQRGGGPRSRSLGSNRQRTAEIRDWARRKGYNVSERGRIASWIVTEYDAEH